MTNKDREKLKTVYKVIALIMAVIMLIGVVFGSFIH